MSTAGRPGAEFVRNPNPVESVGFLGSRSSQDGTILGLGRTAVAGRTLLQRLHCGFIEMTDMDVHDGLQATIAMLPYCTRRRYIRSGVSMPSRFRAMTNWSNAAFDRARREAFIASSDATSTGQAA